MSRSMFTAVAALVLATVAACAEDLTAVTATWTQTSEAWTKTAGDAKKAGEELAGKIGGLAAVADADAAGKDLKAKLDTAVNDHKAVVAELEQIAAETKTAVETAMTEKKIAPVQAALDAGKAKFDASAGKIAAATTAASTAFDALKAHLDEEAKKAADPAAKDPEAAKVAGGTVSIAFAFTDKNAVDEAASAAALDRLVKFLGTCEPLKVDLAANAADEKAGKARADAVAKAIEAKGLKGKVGATAGAVGADNAVVAKVATVCP
jgi:hypothetical protein